MLTLAAELADRALEPVEPLKAGSGHALAISLYREATYWALLARLPDTGPPSLRELFSAQPDALAQSGLGEADLACVREALADKTFIQTANDAPARLARESELCRAFVRALLHGSDAAVDASTAIGGSLAQRWLRVAAALSLAAALALAAAHGLRRAWLGPDLAQGADWTLSNKWTDCHPKQRECGGARTRIFFHTAFQVDPWFQLDLGRVQQVARVRVENRDDCCQAACTASDRRDPQRNGRLA